MSKKIAGSSKNLVLDVKVGDGAFVKTPEEAIELANKMKKIGEACGLSIHAIVSNMNYPLGNKVGNALEIEEAIEVLKNEGPNDIKAISVALATLMNMLVNNLSFEEAKDQVIEVLENGSAYKKFEEWILRQGGNLNIPKSKYTYEIKSIKDGYITNMNTEIVGKVSSHLGGGREKKEDSIDPTAGITIIRKINDYVNKGDTIALFHSSKEDIKDMEKEYLECITFSDEKVEEFPLIFKVIE